MARRTVPTGSRLRAATGYPKLTSDELTVLLLDGDYHLVNECERALLALGHTVVRHRLDSDVGRVTRTLLLAIIEHKPDFVLTINHMGFDDCGVVGAVLSDIEMPLAVWYVDSPSFVLQGVEPPAPEVSTVFLWESTFIPVLESRGFKDVRYLPLATDPEKFSAPTSSHTPLLSSFVGNSMAEACAKWGDMLEDVERPLANELANALLENRGLSLSNFLETRAPRDRWGILGGAATWTATARYRQSILQSLDPKQLHVFGDSGWSQYLPHAHLNGPVAYGPPLSEVYSATQLNINATSLQMPTAVNQRVFDVPASGGFLLSDAQQDILRHFDDGEIITYSSSEELVSLVRHYQSRPQSRDKAIRRARKRVLQGHTYIHRLRELVRLVREHHRSRPPKNAPSRPPVYLNVGCGRHHLPGFINIDVLESADLCADVTQGLPFPNASVDGIYSEHFIEHLSQADGLTFLRECRRVLVPGGVMRIATPDLDALVGEYTEPTNWMNPEWEQFGYGWIQNRCEMLNLGMREWGHEWLYNEQELMRLLGMAGFVSPSRQQRGESPNPLMRDLEHRAGSRLVMECQKPKRRQIETPQVSVLIPAYKSEHFETALRSALEQTHRPLEVVVQDDSESGEIQRIVERVSELYDTPLLYVKNPENLGGRENHVACFESSQGDYIKFLSDDDVLHPECCSRMAACLREYTDVTLVTSHRQTIDGQGKSIPETTTTARFVGQDSILDGGALLDTVLRRANNIIGEPSTAMFRREDVQDIRPHFLSFAGVPNNGLGDVTLWANLLARGDAVYLTETLSYFRIHDRQEQAQPEFRERGRTAWHHLIQAATRKGLVNPKRGVPLAAVPLEERPWWSEATREAVEKAQLAMASGTHGDAMSRWLDASSTTENEPWLLWNVGRAAARKGHTREASQLLTEAIDRHPHFLPTYFELASLLHREGWSEESERVLGAAHSRVPLVDFSGSIERCNEGRQWLANPAIAVVQPYTPPLAMGLALRCPSVATGGVDLEIAVDGRVINRCTLEHGGVHQAVAFTVPTAKSPRVLEVRWASTHAPDGIEFLDLLLEIVRADQPTADGATNLEASAP